jgi:hypothetical protein
MTIVVNDRRQVKGKGHPVACHEGPDRGQRYSSTLSVTSVIDGGGWSTPRPSRLASREREERFARVRKISPSPGFDPQTAQPVASRYTD